MKHRRILATTLLLLIIALFPPAELLAQATKTITFQEAIDLSLKNSSQLKTNEAKIAEATAIVKEANERRLPDFSVSGSYLYLPVKPNINLKSDTSTGGGSGPNVSQAMYGIANISIPLYTGGKLKYGIESAKYLEQAIKLDAEEDRSAVILNTINAFINLYKSKEAVNLVKENLEQSRQRVKDLTNLEKNGLLARNDLLKAELQTSNIELSLLDAENNWRLASVTMALMLGLSEQTELVPDQKSLEQKIAVKTISEYEQDALQSRKDITALGLRKKSADLAIKTARTDYYPNVAFTAGYIAADIPHFLSITNAVNVGIGVKYNLSSLWKTKTKIAQATARSQQLQANQTMLNDDIRLEVNKAYLNYLSGQKKIEVYEKSVTQAAENYRITKNKYDNSLATTTELLDADVASLQAKLNFAFAKADAVAAYNQLLKTAGILTN